MGGVARIVEAPLGERLRHRAAQASGKRDEPSAVLSQQVVIDARLVVEPFQESGGYQLHQVVVTLGIFAEQNEMIVAALGHGLCARLPIRLPVGRRGPLRVRSASVATGFFRAAIVAAGARDVNFATDDGLHAARGGFVMEALGGKQIAVIGDGHSGHAPASGLVD